LERKIEKRNWKRVTGKEKPNWEIELGN